MHNNGSLSFSHYLSSRIPGNLQGVGHPPKMGDMASVYRQIEVIVGRSRDNLSKIVPKINVLRENIHTLLRVILNSYICILSILISIKYMFSNVIGHAV